MIRSRTRVLILLLAMPSIAVAAQGTAPRTLGAPTATFDHEFTGIDGVRELGDGRVVVLDARDKSIHVIDLVAKTDRKIGRDGDGPGEFRLPLKLFAIGGDTTLVADMARYAKLLVVTPAGDMGGFVPAEDGALGIRNFVVGATDGAGRFYENNYSGDSNSIIRWDRGRGRRDTIARISMKIVSPVFRPIPSGGRATGGGRAAASGGMSPPFYALSQWAVSSSGAVAVVTPEPYQVMIVGPSGVPARSGTIRFTPVSVREAEKRAYRAERQKPVPAITFANGAQTSSYIKPPFTEPEEWPSTLPAFLPDAVVFASDGKLWVRRASRAGASPLYDIFGATARLAYQLELPANTKLVGFGASTVYLARVDDDDLHYLQRYALPK